MAAAAKATIQLTFKGLLAKHLWDRFLNESAGEIDRRAMRLITSCKPATGLEEEAWNEALRDRALVREVQLQAGR